MANLKKSSLNSDGLSFHSLNVKNPVHKKTCTVYNCISRILYRWYKYLCFAALLFCVCTQTPDNCGDYERVDYKTQFCYDGKAVPKCAGNKYDPSVEKCADDNSKVEERCINGKYAKSGEPCITAFTVRFDTDGGTPETVSPVTVDSGKTMGSKFPEDPKKTGLIFDGWFHNDKKYDSSTVITENVTIKAKFKLKQFTVKFDTDGGTPETISSVTVDTGKTMGEKLPSNPTKMGYNFDGWFHNDKQYDSSTVIIEDVTLKAKYLVKRFTVQFDTDGGSPSSIEPITVDTGKTLGDNLPSSPTKTGFSFDGWYYADGASYYTTSTPITRNVTLRAQWTTGGTSTTKYTLTINSDPADGGTVNPTSGQEYTLGSEVTVTATPNTGYNFVGWSGASDSKENEVKIKMDDNKTLTAKWMIEITNTITPDITEQPASGTVIEGTPYNIFVKANITDGGKLSYQWYSNTIESNNGGSIINGATDSSYTVSTSVVGTTYYYVIITNTNNLVNGTKEAIVRSAVATVKVDPLPIVHAEKPDIITQPTIATGTVTVGPSDITISVSSNVSDGGTLSYQWYSNTIASNSDGTAISGATNSSYKIPTNTTGIYHYYVEVTNTNNSVNGNTTAKAASDIVTITVTVPPDRHFNPDPKITYSYFIDDRDGKNQMYLTVEIGGKTWMAENLNYKTDDSKCYAYYDTNIGDSYCDKYGRLYPSSAKDACPTGWHLSTNEDWSNLISVVGGEEIAGAMLKSKVGWYDFEGNSSGNGTDNFGFSALPSGGGWDGMFGGIGEEGYWWSSTQSRNMGYSDYIGEYTQTHEKDLFSLRCVKDAQQ